MLIVSLNFNPCPAEYIKMPRPRLIFRQSDNLIRIVAINLHTLWQTMQIQIRWLQKKPTDLNLHFYKARVYPGSAGQGLSNWQKYVEVVL